MQDLPLWQQVSGLSPDAEARFSADERDAAITKLLVEVDRRAKIEFDRAPVRPSPFMGESAAAAVPQHSALSPSELSVPPLCAQRTIYWDPLEGICQDLQIARTKLSRYSRRLTGLRAHEIGDRIKAVTLPGQVHAELEAWLLPDLRRRLPYMLANRGYTQPVDAREHRRQDNELLADLCDRYVAHRKRERAPANRAGIAAKFGWANYARLNRACVLVHGKSFEQQENDTIFNIVQKFLKEHRAKSAVAVPSPLEGEGRRELTGCGTAAERGVRGRPSAPPATFPDAIGPISPISPINPRQSTAELDLAHAMMAEVLRMAEEKEEAERELLTEA